MVTALVELGFALDHVAAVIGHDAGGRETRTLVRHYVRTDQIQRKAEILSVWNTRIAELVLGRADIATPTMMIAPPKPGQDCSR